MAGSASLQDIPHKTTPGDRSPHDGLARRYVLVLITIIGLALAVVATMNVIVDPHQVFRLVTIPALEAVKQPEQRWNPVTKIYGLRRTKPQALVLGSSRARLAIDPQRPEWRNGVGPAYNAAVAGGSVADIRALFALAVRLAPVKVALIEVEFHSFDVNAARPPANLTKDDLRLRLRGLPGLVPGLLFGDTTQTSWQTLQRYFNLVDHPDYFMRLDGKLEFHTDIFDAPLVISAQDAFIFDIWFRPDYNRSFCLQNKATGSDSIADLDQILANAERHGTKVILVVAPMHARRLETISASGLRAQYERWKREMVRVVSNHQRDSRSPGVTLWDFTQYNAISTEDFKLVRKGDRPNLYFWESFHFKDIVGDMILDKLAGTSNPSRPMPDNFGVILTPDNVDAQLAYERDGRETYRKSHPALAAHIDRLVAEATKRVGSARRCE